jgi:hypothetical protein
LPSAVPISTPGLPGLGQPATRNGYALTAFAVLDPCTPDASYTPVPNARPVGVELMFANVSNPDSLLVYPDVIRVVDSDDTVREVEASACSDMPVPTIVSSGEQVRGVYGFVLPMGVRLVSLRYSLGLTSGETLEVSLTR